MDRWVGCDKFLLWFNAKCVKISVRKLADNAFYCVNLFRLFANTEFNLLLYTLFNQLKLLRYNYILKVAIKIEYGNLTAKLVKI